MPANIKAMEIHLRNVVTSALTAQKRLRQARRAVGLRDRPAIYTSAEVQAMRIEWLQRFRGMLHAAHDPKYNRLAQLAISIHNNAKMAKSTKILADEISLAAATSRNGGPERPEPTGLAAEILAAGKKRRKLS